MSSASTIAPGKSRTRLILTRLFQVFIALCLIDGFVDIVYPVLRATRGFLATAWTDSPMIGRDPSIPADELVMPRDAARRREPGISGIVGEYHSPRFNVSADGMRSNGQPAPESADGYGLLLGSSVGFGMGVADNKSLAAQLERALNTVPIANYAGLAQSIPESTLRWYDVQTRKGKPQFVIIAGATFQLYRDCHEPPPEAEPGHRNILLHLAGRLLGGKGAEKGEPTFICTTSHLLDMAVRSSIMGIENTIAFARKQGIPVLIVYMPTPYDKNVNVQNLMKLPAFKTRFNVGRRMVDRYYTELMKLNLPEVIDLSAAFPPDKMYFLDVAGHLTSEGNGIIAARLAALLRDREMQP